MFPQWLRFLGCRLATLQSRLHAKLETSQLIKPGSLSLRCEAEMHAGFCFRDICYAHSLWNSSSMSGLVEGHYGCLGGGRARAMLQGVQRHMTACHSARGRNRTHFIECYAFGRGATRGIAQCLATIQNIRQANHPLLSSCSNVEYRPPQSTVASPPTSPGVLLPDQHLEVKQ